MLHPQLAWYVAGPILGLCVVACRLLFNARLGVTGGFSELVGRLSQGSFRFDWRGWFALGLFVGGAVFALIAGGPDFHGYGWVPAAFTGSRPIWVVPPPLSPRGGVWERAEGAGGCPPRQRVHG